MRYLVAATVAAGLMFSAASAQDYLTFQNQVAAKLFGLSRQAAGGEAAVAGVTSFVMKGTLRVSTGDGGPPERAVEVRYLFPDQYIRIETAGPWSKRSGFSGGVLLTEIRNGVSVDKPPAEMTAGLLRAEKARLARLLLGVASMTTPEVWLTVRQPPGEIDPNANPSGLRVLQVAAKDGFAAAVYYDGPGLPSRVEYEAGKRRVAISFADRRKAGALLLPHLISTTLDGQPLEEIRITEFVINPALTKADFGG